MSDFPSKKVVLITGCSSGFGSLAAIHLSKEKYNVVATMRNLKYSGVLKEEAQRVGGELDIVELDVTKKDTIKSTFDFIDEKYGSLDVLVNNAGHAISGAFEDLTDEEIRLQMDVNFFGVQNVTRAAIPFMRRQAGAKIINISSVAGFSASPCLGAYNSSKFALEGFSESLRYELKMFDIDVLLIEPGVYPTKIFYENRKYCENFHNKQSPYYNFSQHLKNKVDEFLKNTKTDSNEIAELIQKLIEQKNPKFRNRPNSTAKIQYNLRKLLPFSIYSRIIENAFLKNFSESQKG